MNRNSGNRVYLNENYYLLLGVSTSASESEIQRAFRNCAIHYHPDKQNGDKDQFCRLEEAKRILLDPTFRREYDRTRPPDIRDLHLNRSKSNSNQHHNSLPSCHKLSDDIREDIVKWKAQFPKLNLKDNIKQAFTFLLEDFDSKDNDELMEKDEGYFCSICNKEFISEDDHYDQILEPYVTDHLSEYGEPTSIFEFLYTKLDAVGVELSKNCPQFVSESLLKLQMQNAKDLLNNGQRADAHILYQGILQMLQAAEDEQFVMDKLSLLITELLETDPYSIVQGFKWLLITFPHKFADATLIHTLLTKRYMSSGTLSGYKLALAGLHYTGEISVEEFIEKTNPLLSNELEMAINESNFETLSEILNLINLDNLTILHNLIAEKSRQYDLSKVTGDYKAAILLIKGTVSKLELNIPDALTYFQDALEACSESPFTSRDAIALVAVTQLSNQSFHKAAVRQLWADISQMRSNPENLEQNSFPVLKPEFLLSSLFCLKLWHRQMTPGLVLLAQRNEEAIAQRYKTGLEKALGYFDLSMGIGVMEGRLGSFIIGILYLLQEMEVEDNPPDLYAYAKVIQKFCSLSFILTRKYLGPNKQMYIYRLVLSALLRSSLILRDKLALHPNPGGISDENIFSPEATALSTVALNEITKLVKIFLLILTPVQSVTDQILRSTAELTFLTNFIHSKSTNPHQHLSAYFPKHLYSYQEFDGIWRGWGDSDLAGSFEHCRLICMEDMLELKNWTTSDVEQIMRWPLIRRTAQGWMNNEEIDLNFDAHDPSQVFSSCRGMEINMTTGEVTLLLDGGTEDSQKLFSTADIADVFEGDISAAFLTLEDPDPSLNSHPFQEFSYWPPSLQNTDYLYTMLHADYFLKEITTGMEVNSISPFEIRATRDGFLQRLPPEMQLQLRPILERLRDPIDPNSENAHRFWIQLGEVELTTEVKGDKGVVLYEFGKAEISVKTKHLKRNVGGEYEDDEENDPEISSSAEVQLGKFLTKNYDLIGSYFPFLLRLKELGKISGLYRILGSKARQYKETLEVIDSYKGTAVNPTCKELLEDMENNVRRTLTVFRDQNWTPPHPIYTLAKLEQDYQETLALNGLVGKEHQLAPGERDRVRTQITNSLCNADETRFDHCAGQIATLYGIEKATIRSLIRGWFDKNEGTTMQLVDICFAGAMAMERAKMQIFLEEFELIGIRPQKSETVELTNNGECCWVPATFCSKFEPPVELLCERDSVQEEMNRSTESMQGDKAEDQGSNAKRLNDTPVRQITSTDGKQSTLVGATAITEHGSKTETALSEYKGNSVIPVEPKEKMNQENPDGDTDPKSKNGSAEAEEIQQNGVGKKKVPTGIKPPRIYGGVAAQVALNVVSLLLPPPVRMVTMAARVLRGISVANKASFCAAKGVKTIPVPRPTTRCPGNVGGASSGGGSSGGGNKGGKSGGKGGGNSGGKSGSGSGGSGNSGTGGVGGGKTNNPAQPKTTYEAKLGPSGKPMRHFPRSTTRKEAKEKAFHRGGKNKPAHDTAHKPGQPSHYHPVDKDGKRIECGEHYGYGKGDVRAGRDQPKK